MISCLQTILIALVTLSVPAQTPSPPKRKKLKDFGSSLKRLKWNPEKNAAVELPANGKGTNSDEDEYLETPEQAEEIYARIFSDINQRYIVGYYPANKERDGQRRKIDFEVKGHPEYQVYGRRSYFAPGP